MRDGVDDLRAEVVLRAGEQLAEVGPLGHQAEHLVDEPAEPAEQVVDPRDPETAGPCDGHALVGARLEAAGAEERHPVGDAGPYDGVPRVQGLRSGVDGVARHHAVRRQLAAGDHHEPGHRGRDRVLARDLRRGLGGAAQEGAEPGVHALDVLVVERGPQQLVDVLEHVVDVRARGGRVREVEVPRGVGGADDPVAAPGDHEEHRDRGLGDEAALAADPVARHDEVDALAGLDVERAAAAEHLLDLVGPHTAGVDDDLGANLDLAVVLEVLDARPDDAVGLAQEGGDLGPRGDMGAVRRCRARHVHHQTGVVHLAVVVADGSGEVLGAQVGRDPGELAAEEVPVTRDAHAVGAGHREAVVEQEPGADVRPLPGVVQRVEERHRPDEVGRDPGEQQATLLQGLADEAEVEHLQVAQAAVDELGGPRARAAGEVALLDQRGREPAGDRVQRRTRPDHARADHEHVELGALHRVERGRPGARSEVRGQRHGSSLPGGWCA